MFLTFVGALIWRRPVKVCNLCLPCCHRAQRIVFCVHYYQDLHYQETHAVFEPKSFMLQS